MKKFKFTLQNVLTLKENSEVTEKMLLHFLQSKWNNLQDELTNLNNIYEKTRSERNWYAENGTDSKKLMEYSLFIKEIDRKRDLTQEQIYEVHTKINNQVQVLRKIKSEISQLNKIREKQNKAHLLEVGKETDIMIDDFISGRLGFKII